jgi:hypothetical protein
VTVAATGEELIAMYREIAARGEQFRGLSLLSNAVDIMELLSLQAKPIGTLKLLDYGSGAGDAYEPPHSVHEVWGVPKPTLYDPAFDGIDVPPPAGTKFDGVICSDVLEHIPENECERLVNELFGYTDGFVWASVCCRPAKKIFADGTNMHVTVRKMAFWHKLFARVSASHTASYRLVETI